MQIRTLIAVCGGTCIVAIFIVASVLQTTYFKLSISHSRSHQVTAIGVGASGLSTLTGEYLLHPGERPRKQWQGKHETLGRLLSQFESDNAQDVAEIIRIQDQHIEAGEVFSQLLRLRAKSTTTSTVAKNVLGPLEARLATQLLTALHTMTGRSSHMASRFEEGANRAIQDMERILSFFITVGIVVFIWVWGWVTWRVAHPVAVLHKGIDAIANGDLKRQISGLHHDEFGSIAKRINTMAKNLEETLVSRDSLKEEIVQRLNAEKELKVTLSALSQANSELEQFTYSVSHDLRAPLRSIDGFSQALFEDYHEKLDGDALQFLQYLREGSQEISTLVDALLKLSRSTRGEMVFEDVDLSEIAQNVVAQLCREDTLCQDAIDIQPDITVYGDPRLMKVMLTNLIGNAWKFSCKEKSPRIKVRAEMQGNDVILSVQDNGAGFDMAYVDKLFAPFQRLHSMEEFKGTGIGLSTVQRIAARHGGRTWGEGKVGEGATLYVQLPKGETTHDK